jgi:DHA2 family multidrug resistance protein-like MFS transporter
MTPSESPSKAPPQSHADGLPAPRRYVAIAVLLLTLVLVVLDGAIANIALPSIASSFHASESDTVWVVSSYQLAVLIALLPCGALGEILGPRRVYLTGVVIFVAASAACALAPSLAMLIAARFAQGFGGGAIMALAVMNLRHTVPQRQLGAIIGVNAMTIAISSAAGPGIAGAILAVAKWPWLFAVNIPTGLIVLALGGVLARIKGSGRRFDAGAVIANSLMFALFFSGADRISRAPLTGSVLIMAALACLVVLLRLEKGKPAPILPVDLFRDPAFRVAVIGSVCCFTGQMLSYIALPFYLQYDLHMTPTEAGLYMMPWPIAVAVIAPISGQLANHVRTAYLCAAGGALLAAGLAFIAFCPVDAHGISFVTGSVLAGIGFGLFQTPNNRILLLSAPKARAGAAGGMQGTARLSGQTFGAIAMSLIFAFETVQTAPRLALIAAAVFALAAAAASLSRARYETAG